MPKTKKVPYQYRVEPGNAAQLENQLRIANLEELAALRRRALAWEQFRGEVPPVTAQRIHALETHLYSKDERTAKPKRRAKA